MNESASCFSFLPPSIVADESARSPHAQEILIALDWEVFGVLRRAGFNCTVCPPGEQRPDMC